MALSSGSRSVVSEVAVWVCLACTPVAGWLAYQHMRPMLGLDAADHAATDQSRATVATHAFDPELPRSGYRVELRADSGGHFMADAYINGRRVAVMVDTGATIVALSNEDAAAAGIFPRESDFTGRVNTANGIARVAYVMLDSVAIGDITVRGVRAAIAERGRLSTSLLGMSFLSKLKRAEISRSTLVLED
jgi:aspartyl protease family protein